MRRAGRRTPTDLFLGLKREELGERLVGACILDFYGALFEQRLDAARAALRERELEVSQNVTFLGSHGALRREPLALVPLGHDTRR